MRFFHTVFGILTGIFVGVTMLWSAANLLNVRLSDVSETPGPATVTPTTVTPTSATNINATQQRLFRLASARDINAVSTLIEQAHQQSLTGEISYDDLRTLFTAFESTAPEMREFTETWVDEMPNSAHALTALAWNLYANGWHMRGHDLAMFTYPEASARFHNATTRVGMLIGRAKKDSLDFIPTSDISLSLAVTNAQGFSEAIKLKRVSRILDRIMRLTPNHDSLIRAIAVAQPNWGGSYDDAVALCLKYADMVTDLPGYTPDICQIDAAYTYEFGAEIRNKARKALQSTDLAYLEYARQKDWQPGISRRADREILAYLNGEGRTDLFLARRYDGTVARRNGLPEIAPTVRKNQRLETLETLKTDPFNPRLIEKIVNLNSVPADDPNWPDRSADIEMAKRALTAAPYDPSVWTNIAEIINGSADHTDPTENAFFANAITFSNHHPNYYFQYLTAKNRDYQMVTLDLKHDRLEAAEIPAALDATLCPLIRLERLHEMMCSAPDEYLNQYDGSCDSQSDPQTPLQKRIAEAETFEICSTEINADIREIYFMKPADTGIELPKPLNPLGN